MRRLFIAAAWLLAYLSAAPNVALAQTGTPARALTTCGSPGNSPVNGNYYSITTDLKSQLCVNVGGTGTSATQVQGTSASGATDDGSNPVKIGCIGAVGGFYVSISGGQRGNVACSNHGAIGISAEGGGGFVGLATGSTLRGDGAQALQTEATGLTFSEITTATSTTVKGSAGIVHRVAVNTCVASATIKLYNASSATGTPITITCPSTVGNPFYIDYDAYFGTAIFVVTSGATDVTVLYR